METVGYKHSSEQDEEFHSWSTSGSAFWILCYHQWENQFIQTPTFSSQLKGNLMFEAVKRTIVSVSLSLCLSVFLCLLILCNGLMVMVMICLARGGFRTKTRTKKWQLRSSAATVASTSCPWKVATWPKVKPVSTAAPETAPTNWMEPFTPPGTNAYRSQQLIFALILIRVELDLLTCWLLWRNRNLETLAHLIKGNIGTGIFAMPSAMKHSGLWVGGVILLIVASICIHCMQMLVRHDGHVTLTHCVCLTDDHV